MWTSKESEKKLLPKNHPQRSAKLPKMSWLPPSPPLFFDVINEWPLGPTFKNPNFEFKEELRKAISQNKFYRWK